MNVLAEHLPHIGIAIVVFLVVFWLWLENARAIPEDDEESARAWTDDRARYRTRTVRWIVARRASLLLVAMLGAIGTGAWLYRLDLSNAPRGAFVVIAHCAFGVAVAIALIRKQCGIGNRRLLRAIRHGRTATVGNSLLLMGLTLPLMITGVLLIFSPAVSGVSASLHLIVAIWWTVFVGAHLHRYAPAVVSSIRAKRREHQAQMTNAVSHSLDNVHIGLSTEQ